MTESPGEQADAVQARPWRPGDPPIRRRRIWPPGRGPACEVRLDGQWRPAQVTMRQDMARRPDMADLRTVYHLRVMLHEVLSPAYRAVYWDPATLRPRD